MSFTFINLVKEDMFYASILVHLNENTITKWQVRDVIRRIVKCAFKDF
jgi:hypothetical protein